jgi:hypothetical protein
MAAPRGALAEFLVELGIGHGVGGAALAEVGLPAQHGAVVQLDLDDRGHLVEAAASASGCHVELHLGDHGLHVGTVHRGVGELLEPALALEEQDRHAELHAELGPAARWSADGG